MIERIIDLPEQVLGIKATGEVSAEDYQRVLVPALEEKLRQHRRVRLLYVLGDGFKGYTGGAAWEDAKVGMKHLTAFERVAIVTDVDWIENMVKALGFALPGEVRVFDDDDLDDARTWISEPPATGDLEFWLLEEQGVLVLEPHGELEVGDFDRLSAAVDPYVASEGQLKGLMIVTKHFPGWDDFTALTSHVRFVKGHQKQIRRVAIVSDDRLLSVLPGLASKFLSAEVRSFPASERDQALLWVGEN